MPSRQLDTDLKPKVGPVKVEMIKSVGVEEVAWGDAESKERRPDGAP